VAGRADPPMDAMIRWRVVLFAAKLPVASVGEAATRCFAFIEALLCHHRLTPPCGPGGVRSRAKHAVKPKNQAAVEIGSQRTPIRFTRRVRHCCPARSPAPAEF
jgi:hypothetical protein